MKQTHAASLPVPDSLGPQFSVLAGSYVAALAAPAITLFVIGYFDLHNWVLSLGILVVVGVSLVFVVGQLVTDNDKMIRWLNTGWLPWLFPFGGFIPLFAYYFNFIEFFIYLYSGFNIWSANSIVGATGFLLGIIAGWLGELMIRTVRSQIASFAIENEDVTIEWTAAWPRDHKIKTQIVVVLPCLAVAILIARWYSLWTAVYTLPVVFTVLLATKSALADRVYRVSPSGLEHLREGRIHCYKQFLPWSQIDGFTVTSRAIVLHRSSLRPDIRFSRRDLRLNEEEVISALEEYIDQRNS